AAHPSVREHQGIGCSGRQEWEIDRPPPIFHRHQWTILSQDTHREGRHARGPHLEVVAAARPDEPMHPQSTSLQAREVAILSLAVHSPGARGCTAGASRWAGQPPRPVGYSSPASNVPPLPSRTTPAAPPPFRVRLARRGDGEQLGLLLADPAHPPPRDPRT